MMMFQRQQQVAALLVSWCLCVCAQEDSDYLKLKSELELIQWDLQEECSTMSRNERMFLEGKPEGLRFKIKGEVEHASFLRRHAAQLKHYDDVPYNLKRNWTQFTRCGDALLGSDEYYAFNVFSNKNLQLKLHDTFELMQGTTTLAMNARRVHNTLATARNVTLLENVWTQWVAGTIPFKEWYYGALHFVREAAEANYCDSAQAYWELLSDMPDGYEQGRRLYENIKPFYDKLRNFVETRLSRYYNVTFEDGIPVHLTGSLQGDDWTHIASIILPQPQIYYDIKVELEAREIHDLYVYASNCTRNLGFGHLTDEQFFKESTFDASACDTHILNFCAEQYSSIFTCNETSLDAYFKAHEALVRLGITNVNFHAQMRESLRSSPIIEGLSSMASLLSCNGMLQNKILPRYIFEDNPDRENYRMTMLLLLALRVFPKIAYYHAMDEFRLELLEQERDSDVEGKYEEVKMRIQGVSLPQNATKSLYLRDEFILYNRPYLSKMFGQFLQFQLLEHYQIDLFEETDASLMFNRDTNFKEFIAGIPNEEPMDLLRYYFQIDQIDEQPLLSFFAGLENYMDNAPEEQETFQVKQALYVKPTTTSTTTVNAGRKKVHNLGRKLDRARSGTAQVVPVAINDDIVGTSTVATTKSLVPTAAKSKIGVYIGAGIVILTVLIIATGFVMQRRRTHKNHRRYNA